MREIKFRAKHRDATSMVDWERIKKHYLPHIFTEPESWTVMQFTGLHDKNGKEIYEGDVVRMQSNGGDVTVTFGPMEMTGCGCHNGYGYPLPQENNDPEEWEVIGNIYENPELIQKT